MELKFEYIVVILQAQKMRVFFVKNCKDSLNSGIICLFLRDLRSSRSERLFQQEKD